MPNQIICIRLFINYVEHKLKLFFGSSVSISTKVWNGCKPQMFPIQVLIWRQLMALQ